ncbi:GNAT family N-acetyltransferase [Cellulomonas septica]|uniref:GNAT family N-acetyltransferase n=1 Tax=Cellulomonas septica TaxID=285080 RepID=A0ABX1K2V8_9CELL|nr:GNAT family N-acetyltransferase [Cellulomonas septica]NKY40901.1 GNAT family N-acetyltransferase [Cellulomonas septica]
MSAPEFLIREPHEFDAGLESFTCGNAVLDTWLRETAARAHKAGSVRVRLLWDLDSYALVGYYAVCPTEVRRDELPLASKLRGGASTVPGFMLAKLAIATDVQGGGLGRDLLIDALEHICDAAELVGGRIIVVDPIDESAAAFYLRYGFQRVANHTRMFVLVQDARRSLDLD